MRCTENNREEKRREEKRREEKRREEKEKKRITNDVSTDPSLDLSQAFSEGFPCRASFFKCAFLRSAEFHEVTHTGFPCACIRKGFELD